MNRAELKQHFESNMLDGDNVETCGNAMLGALSVWDYIQEIESKHQGELLKAKVDAGYRIARVGALNGSKEVVIEYMDMVCEFFNTTLDAVKYHESNKGSES